MNRKSFYNDARRERKIDFLANWRTVRWYFCRKYNLPKDDLEYLLKLDSMDIFDRRDADNEGKILAWSKARWDRLRRDGWVDVFAERDKNNKYKKFRTSRKCREVVTLIYRTLCGEVPIPESGRSNPIAKREAFTEKVYMSAIEEFNKLMAAKRDTE